MSDRNLRFDEALDAGFRDYLRSAPEVATFAGLTAHDGELPDVSREGLESRIRTLGTWSAQMTALAAEGVDAERATDARLLARVHELVRFEHEEIRAWEANPDALEDVGSLFFLSSFADYGSPEERHEKAAARLEAIPEYLRRTRARVTRPEPRWARVAADVAEGFPSLLDALARSARDSTIPESLKARVESAAHVAEAATLVHRTWCTARTEGPDRWPIGAERLSRLLDLKGLPNVKEVEALGEKYLAELLAERARISEQIAPGQGFEAAMAVVKAEHPATFEEAIATVRDLVAQSRAKVIQDEIADLPEGEVLDVLETPEFLRALTPFAAIFPAPKFAKVQRGLYIVTRPDAVTGLEEVHYADLRNVVCHEGYPGHHLQLSTANRRASLVRSVDLTGFPAYAGIVFAIDLVEGWAHYCEQMMKEHGFHDSPADRMVLVNDALWRAVRILLDVRMHTGRIGYGDAVAFLRAQTGMSAAGAASEVTRYTLSPTYQLSYLVGKHLLLELREDFRKAAGAGYRERDFHALVLNAGNIPVSEVRRLWASQGKPVS